MTESSAKPDPTDWEALVETGLARIEMLAGDTWTDFNDHDPGVTLLHALAYALTDLGYRAQHPIADLLTGPDGQIDADGGCLFPPERIFPCAPVSLLDLRKRLLDEMPGLLNVWIDRSSEDPALGGRYQVWLLPAPDAGGTSADLVGTAERLLSSMRPLGDVFDEVSLFSTVTLTLSITATTSSDRTSDEIVQDAQTAVNAALSPPIAFQSRTGPSAPTLPPDILYEGPWLAHGTLDDAALWSPRQASDVEYLVREALERTDGIEDISSLSITFSPARPATALPPQAFTWDAYAGNNEFVFNGKPYDPAVSGYPGPSAQASSARSPASLKPAPEDLDSATAIPAGVFVDAGRYDAVQDSLPPMYGLEKNGLPLDAPAQRVAEARQLRGYLFVFEQILANQFAQLAHARKLLSWRDEPTHVWQSLDALTGADEVLSGVGPDTRTTLPTQPDEVLPIWGTPYAAGVQAVVTSWNQAYGQGEAVADHLLSRFAESLPSLDWQNFETLSQKRSFLERYPDFSQNRHVGFDVALARQQKRPDPDNVSWLERKLNLLLAAGPRQPLRVYDGEAAATLEHSAAAGYQIYLGRSYYLLEHPLFIDGIMPAGGARGGTEAVPKAFFVGQLSHVLTNWTFRELRPEFQAYVESFLQDAAPAHLVHHFLWRSAEEMDRFAVRLSAWYRDQLRPLIIEGQDSDTLWVRPTGAAWELVSLLRSWMPAGEAPR